MTRKLSTFLIVSAIILFGLILLWPAKASRLANNILKGFVAIEQTRLPLPGFSQPVIKIVDPDAISSTLKEESSNLLALFKNQKNNNDVALNALDIIDETNKRRIASNIVPLKTNQLLVASAKIKTEDMITLQYFEHESPSGVSVSDLGTKVGYDYIIMGENLALGNFEDASDLLDAWMDSPGHRANILNGTYQEIGVYAVKGTYEGREVWFAVQHFGTGRSACPIVSKTLKNTIDAINASLNQQQKEIEALKNKIEAMNPHQPEYDDEVDTFNEMVNTYNQMLGVSRQKISEYNTQVASFNACLVQYQN